jgi:ligand-binding SRPBCC domain-containing protein
MAGKRRTFKTSTRVPADIHQVWEFHSKPAALETLSPPEMNVSVGDREFSVTEGASLTIWMSPKGTFLRFPWVSKFKNVTPPFTFTDIQTIGPFAHWEHSHSFVSDGRDTIIKDEIEFAVPGWFIGDWILGALVTRQLTDTFQYRSELLTSRTW